MHILFDLSRCLRRSRRSTRTGIDRVDLAFGRNLPATGAAVTYVAGRDDMRQVSVDAVQRALDADELATGDDPVYRQLAEVLASSDWTRSSSLRLRAGDAGDLSPLRRGMEALRLRATSAPLPQDLRDSLYLNTSHSGFERSGRLAALRERGTRIVALLHDLIPTDFPEFCRDAEPAKHEKRLENMAFFADHLLSVSDYSKQRFQAWARRRSLSSPGISVVPLGVGDVFLQPSTLSAPRSPLPYFVCLGTIEARKNHALLLLAWRRLAEELGERCPRLVIVGRRGWKVELALDLLGKAQTLGRCVVEVADLSDDGVAALIRGAHGVLQPSLVEGFGLPIIEAAALGVPVLASDIPAHREVAVEGTILLDPLDAPAWLDAIRKLAGRETGRIARYAVRDWKMLVAQAAEVLATVVASAPRKA